MQTSTPTSTVVGVFADNARAQSAVHALTAAGYSRDQLEVMANDSYTSETERDSGGGVSGFFRRLFGNDVDEDERGLYSDSIRRGSTVVCVHTTAEDQNRAADILDDAGAIDIDKRRQSLNEGSYPVGDGGNRRDKSTIIDSHRDRSIPVVEEQLRVGKRVVKRGGVRIYNQVREEPVEEKLNLREERVHVDRRSVDRPATQADFQKRDEVIEVTEHSEEPVIEKRTRVVEEVVVGKDVTNRTEVVRDKVRRGDVSVERLGGEVGDIDSEFRAHYDQRFASMPSARYETYAPAYVHGYRMASDPRYQGRTWDDVEPSLRTDYERTYPGSKWEQFKEAVRHGWDKMTGERDRGR
jgi:uncharacterized protein (TIGR02271 family)